MSEGYIQKGLREIPSKGTLGNMQEGTKGHGFASRSKGSGLRREHPVPLVLEMKTYRNELEQK
uniref:Uncharacterized protein n=1 Tax=Oryza brachyantha TaxID=4533 RepID=J3M6Q3_ORYBR